MKGAFANMSNSQNWFTNVYAKPSFIFCTTDAKKPAVNPKLEIFIDKAEHEFASHKMKRDIAMDEAKYQNAIPSINISCEWDTETALCSKEEASKFPMVAMCNDSSCESNWVDDIGAWSIKPPKYEVKEAFTLQITLMNLITTSDVGNAFLYIEFNNIPGIENNKILSLHVDRVFKVTVESFDAKPKMVVVDEKVVVSWDVLNASACYLNNIAQNPRDALEQTISEPTTFYLSAMGFHGDLLQDKVTIETTNWKEIGVIKTEQLPIEKLATSYNNRIFYYNSKLYLFIDGYIYESEDEGKTWSKLTTERKIPTDHKITTQLCGDKIYVAGTNFCEYYSIEDKTWSKLETNFAVQSYCASYSIFGETPNLITGVKNMIYILSYNSRDNIWSTSFLKTTALNQSLNDVKSATMEMFQGNLYLAVRKNGSDEIMIFKSSNTKTWMPFSTVKKITGEWFQLRAVGNSLCLLHAGDIVNVAGSQTVQYKNFLPKFEKEAAACPWVGASDDGLYALTISELVGKSEAIMWKFIPFHG